MAKVELREEEEEEGEDSFVFNDIIESAVKIQDSRILWSGHVRTELRLG